MPPKTLFSQGDSFRPGEGKEARSHANSRLKFQIAKTIPHKRSHSRGAIRPRFAINLRPENRGRGECRMPDAPAASCALLVVSMHTSIHSEPPENTRHSRTQWFTAYTALPGDRLSCHRRRRGCLHRLDTSVGVSGPHVFAVRVGSARQARRRVHRTPPRVRDVRETPL